MVLHRVEVCQHGIDLSLVCPQCEQLLAAEGFDAEEFEAIATELLTIPYCPWSPTDVQKAFLLDMGREALFGGAVGGGKSCAFMMAASQFLLVPGYSALLLRKTFADLNRPGA